MEMDEGYFSGLLASCAACSAVPPPPHSPRLAPVPTAAYDQILDGKKRMSAFKQAGWGEKDKK